MMFRMTILLITFVLLVAVGAVADEPLRILYVTKSEGFEHGPVAEKDGQASYSAKVFDELAGEHNWEVTVTKDAAKVNAENLADYDIVMFYTQGDLTKMGSKDEGKPMAENGSQELIDWVKAGGGFVAIHSGTDTFKSTGDAPSDYIAMVGGEFRGHGPQFKGTLKVVSPGHPIAAEQPETWYVMEEWYLFRHLDAENMHVLAVVDPGKMGNINDAYDLPDYPMVWCSAYGDGRVYVNGMGHREDVWDSENFQNWLVNGIQWAAGEDEAQAEPNFEEVISDTLDPESGQGKPASEE
ncbi:MAG: ThuA domain-containing protein [Candidatus Hydrogenedentota bacterium]